MAQRIPALDRVAFLEADIRALPSLLSQLVYLAQIRDINTGVYSSDPSVAHASGQALHNSLEKLHDHTFRRWLELDLAERKAEFERYVSALAYDLQTVVRTWLDIEPYRCLAPISASRAERILFVSDFQFLLQLFTTQMRKRANTDQSHSSFSCEESEFLTVGAVAARLRVSGRTLRLWAELGTIPALKVGRLWRFRAADVEKWLRLRATSHEE